MISRNDERKGRSAFMELRVMSNSGLETLVAVTDLIRKRKLPVEEVFLDKGTLDSVFRKITAQTE